MNLHPRDLQPDTSGFYAVAEKMQPWSPDASLPEIARHWDRIGYRNIEQIDAQLADPGKADGGELRLLMSKSKFLLYEGAAEASYDTLTMLRSKFLANEKYARNLLANVIFAQGIAAFRKGENDNCILCRGESSCIVPISAAAVHTNPTGSRLAIKHFKEYLELFPDDVGVRWLLERRPHDPRRNRTKATRDSGVDRSLLPLRIRHRQVSRHRPRGRTRSVQSGRRSDHG